MIKGIPVWINKQGRVARPQDLITQWQKPLPQANGIALTHDQLEQLKRETLISFAIWLTEFDPEDIVERFLEDQQSTKKDSYE